VGGLEIGAGSERIGYKRVDWTNLAQDRTGYVMNTAVNLWDP
jgi:hypothetical protein